MTPVCIAACTLTTIYFSPGLSGIPTGKCASPHLGFNGHASTARPRPMSTPQHRQEARCSCR